MIPYRPSGAGAGGKVIASLAVAAIGTLAFGCRSKTIGGDAPDGGADAASGSGDRATGSRSSGGAPSTAGAGGGGDPGDASTGGSGPSTGSGGNEGGVSECAVARIGDLGINVVGGTTIGAEDRFSPSCGTGAAPDIAFEWTAPATDYYAIDTFGSDFDTVLSVHASCMGPDFLCNDDTPSAVQSQVVARFDEGQTMSIAVGGRLGETGRVQLSVQPVTCPASDLSAETFPLTLTTVGGSNAQGGPCGGAGMRERTFRFTPEESALYRFSVRSNVIDPALHLEAGAQCGGPLLACNAGFRENHPAEVTRHIDAGDSVTLIVDSTSGEGEFELDIQKIEGPCDQGRPLPVDRDNITGPEELFDSSSDHLLAASCSVAGADYGGVVSLAEHRYPITIDESLAGCTLEVWGTDPMTLYLVSGSQCEGEELECISSRPDTNPNEPTYNEVAALTFSPALYGEHVLVIERVFVDQLPAYRLELVCLA